MLKAFNGLGIDVLRECPNLLLHLAQPNPCPGSTWICNDCISDETASLVTLCLYVPLKHILVISSDL